MGFLCRRTLRRPGSKLCAVAVAAIGVLASIRVFVASPVHPTSFNQRSLRSVRTSRAATSEAGDEARERFLSLLAEKDGDWRDEAITKELELLEKANPTTDAAYTGEYQDGDWVQVTKADYNFGNKGSTDYTLGQLSFNMYAPSDLKCRVDETTQLVAPLGSTDTRTWNIKLSLTCVDERYPPFKADIVTYGEITPEEDKDGNKRRLGVVFNKGTLKPAAGTDSDMLQKWNEIFSDAVTQKKKSIGSKITNFFLGLMMGLKPPEGVDKDGTVTFQMTKPPKGWTDILFLDDKLRVTKGNRGSIIAATRKA